MKNSFLKLIVLLSIGIISAFPALSQGTAINVTGATADPSAMLDVYSNSKGILIPRMTESQKNAIQNPAAGLLIYQTDGTTGFWYFNGSSWVQSLGTTGATGSTGPTGPTGPAGSSLLPTNIFSATAWQSSNTSSNWENISTISYTIPQTGLYQVICSYESEAGTGGTTQKQRLLLGSYIGNQESVIGSGYQFKTISNMATLSAGSVIYLQNQNDWNYGYKNTVKNIQFSIIKLD